MIHSPAETARRPRLVLSQPPTGRSVRLAGGVTVSSFMSKCNFSVQVCKMQTAGNDPHHPGDPALHRDPGSGLVSVLPGLLRIPLNCWLLGRSLGSLDIPYS